MRLDDPYALEFEYIQQMMMWTLFTTASPQHIVQLGLDAGSLTKFCHQFYSQSNITAVELSPAVVDICRTSFLLPNDDERLKVLVMDAMDYVREPNNYRSIDILQVDLYDAQAHKPVHDSPGFYQACADSITDTGMMTVNLFCDAPEHSHNLEAIGEAFEAVAWLPEVHDGNVVAIAFKTAPVIEFDDLYTRAKQIQKNLSLPAHKWVDDLMQWMA